MSGAAIFIAYRLFTSLEGLFSFHAIRLYMFVISHFMPYACIDATLFVAFNSR